MKLFHLVAICGVVALSGISYAMTQEKPILAGKKTNEACLSTKALSGDPDTARLCAAQHLKSNKNLLRYWTQIAAENGDVVSQYNYAIILLNGNNKHDKARAIFWLKKASAKGSVAAKNVLEDIRLNPNSTIPVAPPLPDSNN